MGSLDRDITMCLKALQQGSAPSPMSRKEAAADDTPEGCGRAAREGCTERGQVNWTWKDEEECIMLKRQERPFENFPNLRVEK